MSQSSDASDRASRAKTANLRKAQYVTATYDGAYGVDDFLVPASDSKGHSDALHVRVNLALTREVAVIVASKKFPFKDASDVYRWCIFQGLRALNELEEIPASVMVQAELAVDLARQILFQKNFLQHLTTFGEAFTALQNRGATKEMLRLYEQIRAHLERMPDGYWKDAYREELETRWGRLVGRGPQAEVVPLRLARPVTMAWGETEEDGAEDTPRAATGRRRGEG